MQALRLEVYNVLGQRIATLVNEHQTAGSKVVSWNGKDSVGNDVASGVYFYRINAGDFVEMKKMILLR
ncbi:MAG: T9SS type A sorting domain-containing protein [Candidatus Aminicenantes bacterium]|nr:MAG: T9SS type A sorting domain-containing protein [Candidatus Aminicenantes bacterium]